MKSMTLVGQAVLCAARCEGLREALGGGQARTGATSLCQAGIQSCLGEIGPVFMWPMCWVSEQMTTQYVRCYNDVHLGPRGSPEKRGVDAKIQEDQVRKDVLSIARHLRPESRAKSWGRGGGIGQCIHGKKGGSLHASHDGLARAPFIQPGLSLWNPPGSVSSPLRLTCRAKSEGSPVGYFAQI